MVSSSKFVSENLIPSEVRHQFDRVPGAKQKVVEKKGELYFIMELDSKRYPPLASCRLEDLQHLKFPHVHVSGNGAVKWGRKMKVLHVDPDNGLKIKSPPVQKLVIEKKIHDRLATATFYDGELINHRVQKFTLINGSHNQKNEVKTRIEDIVPQTSSRAASQIATSDHAGGSVISSHHSDISGPHSFISQSRSVRSGTVAGSVTSSKR